MNRSLLSKICSAATVIAACVLTCAAGKPAVAPFLESPLDPALPLVPKADCGKPTEAWSVDPTTRIARLPALGFVAQLPKDWELSIARPQEVVVRQPMGGGKVGGVFELLTIPACAPVDTVALHTRVAARALEKILPTKELLDQTRDLGTNPARTADPEGATVRLDRFGTPKESVELVLYANDVGTDGTLRIVFLGACRKFDGDCINPYHQLVASVGVEKAK